MSLVDVTAVVAGIRAALLGALGFSASARLRSEIYRNVDLVKRLREAELKEAADTAADIVTDEVLLLHDRRKAARERVRPWDTAILALVTTPALLALGWLLLPPGGWLSWVGLVAVGAGLFFFVVGGLLAFFRPAQPATDGEADGP
jgi:hypothetical protein